MTDCAHEKMHSSTAKWCWNMQNFHRVLRSPLLSHPQSALVAAKYYISQSLQMLRLGFIRLLVGINFLSSSGILNCMKMSEMIPDCAMSAHHDANDDGLNDSGTGYQL